MTIHVVTEFPADVTPLFVIGGDHHLHQHQYHNFLNDKGIPNRVAHGMSVLEQGYSEAFHDGLPLIINGDLTHNKNSLDPLVTSMLSQFFDEKRNFDGSPIYLIPGNHEKPEKFRNVSTLDVFAGGNVVLIKEPEVINFSGTDVALVPFAYDHKAQVKKIGRPAEVFVGHYPTSGVNLGKHVLQCEVKFEDFEPHRYLALLFNDIHKHQAVGTNGYHLGATMQNNFGEEGYDCGWWTVGRLDTAIYLKRIETPAPRFHYVDKDSDAMSLQMQGHYARVRPQAIVKKIMETQESARLDFNLQDMATTLRNYVKFQVDAGRFKAEDTEAILAGAAEVL